MEKVNQEIIKRIGLLVNDYGSQEALAAAINKNRPDGCKEFNRDSINNCIRGTTPKANLLIALSKTCNVSTDWILGLVPVEMRTPDTSIRSTMAVTGFSEKAINSIQAFKRESDLSMLLETDEFIRIIPWLDDLRLAYNRSVDAINYLLEHNEPADDDEWLSNVDQLTEYFPSLRMILFELSEMWSDTLEALFPTKDLIADGKELVNKYRGYM